MVEQSGSIQAPGKGGSSGVEGQSFSITISYIAGEALAY